MDPGIGTYNGTTNGTIITIENWELYQNVETNNDTKNETSNETTKRTSNGTHNRKHIRESNKEKAENNPPKSPHGGTTPPGVIPEMYRDQFKTYAEYVAWRNQ